MAIHNHISLYVDGINRTSSLVYPFKYGNFLDERLDECLISLRQLKKDYFEPLTPVEVVVRQTEYFGKWGSKNVNIVGKKEFTRKYVVGDDTPTEVTQGTGIYNHELYCLEVTKVAERVIVDTLTETNNLGMDYTSNAVYAVPEWI